jgi:non-ribosomal peptide synthetase component F
MVNEGARILEEGHRRAAGRHRRGLAAWLQLAGLARRADALRGCAGAPDVAARLAGYAKATGDESLAPAPLLARLAAEGKGFRESEGRLMPHAWEASYPPECRWDARIEPGTLPGFLDEIAARWGEQPALEYRGTVVSYAGLKALADRVAAGLIADGGGRGDCVALYLPNTPWHPVMFFAALRTGARGGASLGARCAAGDRAQGA